jgi:hypothetical protein
MAGYSGTPLAKKLGIIEGTTLLVINPPSNYLTLLAPVPDGVRRAARLTPSVDLVHVFSTTRAHLTKVLRSSLASMRQDAAIWVSWPKRTSNVSTDITEDTIRDVALPLGLVDIKVCAVDDTWSGLKLVIRRENRR